MVHRKVRKAAAGVLLGVGAALSASSAFAWGSATHAHIDYVLRSHAGQHSWDEIYGGMAPDVFNYLFEVPQCLAPLYAKTHYFGGYLELATALPSGQDRGLVYGWVSHNNDRGADVTAHGPLTDPAQGYVIQKEKALEAALEAALGVPDLSALFGGNQGVVDEFCHTLVEFGVDILMREVDPDIGRKMTAAAAFRTWTFPEGLAEAYADDLAGCSGVTPDQAAARIRFEEGRFRQMIAAYGIALDSPDEAAVLAAVTAQLTQLAEAFLAANGSSLPPSPPFPPASTLIANGLAAAMELCRGDYRQEVDRTIRELRRGTVKRN